MPDKQTLFEIVQYFLKPQNPSEGPPLPKTAGISWPNIVVKENMRASGQPVEAAGVEDKIFGLLDKVPGSPASLLYKLTGIKPSQQAKIATKIYLTKGR
jgi:hypothetical protein